MADRQKAENVSTLMSEVEGQDLLLDDPSYDANHPEAKAGFFSRTTLGYYTPVLKAGNKSPITDASIWPPRDRCGSANVYDAFVKAYKIKKEKKGGKRVGIFKILMGIAGWGSICWAITAAFINVSIGVASALLLQFVLTYVEDRELVPSWWPFDASYWPYAGRAIPVIFFLLSIMELLTKAQAFQRMNRAAITMRAAMASAIFAKSLRLSNASLTDNPNGQILNHLSADATIVVDHLRNVGYGLARVVQVAGVVTLLRSILGPAAYTGIIVLVATLAVNGILGLRVLFLVAGLAKASDHRVEEITKFMDSIRVIKMYGWVPHFVKRIHGLRDIQVNKYGRPANVMIGLIAAIIQTAVPLVTLVTFTLYVRDGNQMTPDVVFPALALFQLLLAPAFQITFMLVSMAAIGVSMSRVAKFLDAEEATPVPQATGIPVGSITIQNAQFRWGASSVSPLASKDEAAAAARRDEARARAAEAGFAESSASLLSMFSSTRSVSTRVIKAPPRRGKKGKKGKKGMNPMMVHTVTRKTEDTLEDITLSASPGELVMVVGPVSSGKSSILSAIIQELPLVSKSVFATRGKFAYVPQQAWVLNATVRDNICFGAEYDEQRMGEIIAACSLREDLAKMDAGIDTEIGERGTTLSGGQKQRLSIARALYQEADIFLFDDPLSALDAHVGDHIFRKAMAKYLKGKTRILVTNKLDYLDKADKILVMEDGLIKAQGTYKELRASGHLSKIANKLRKQGESGRVAPGMSMRSSASAASTATVASVPLGDSEYFEENANVGRGRTGTIIQDEELATGAVPWKVYKTYLPPMFLALVILMFVVAQATFLGRDGWWAIWADPEILGLDLTDQEYISIGTMIVFGSGFVVAVREVLFALGFVRSGQRMHRQLIDNVSRQPMSFFDTTPVGRIINRATKDMTDVDGAMPLLYDQFFGFLIYVLSIVIAIGYIQPAMFVLFLIAGYFGRRIQVYYLATSRDIKRLESIRRAPILSYFSQSLAGLDSVRAYGSQNRTFGEFRDRLDRHSGALTMTYDVMQWLEVRLEFLGSFIVVATAAFVVYQPFNELSPGEAGFAMVYALILTSVLGPMVTMGSAVEYQMSSVQRILDYAELAPEAPDDVGADLESDWPSQGAIEFKNVYMRYRADLDWVFEDFSVAIEPQSRVGIVGRTGSGKSTLLLLLFRLVEVSEGSVYVDGIDIGELGLQDLRTRLAIIPQDPVLFTGTIRENLDPFRVYPDADVWKCIRAVGLGDKVERLEGKLNFEVQEGGNNFSLGERQLVCVARAMIRQPRVLLMDEATASLDFQTDRKIQEMIRKYFADSTVVTIAHRINTVMDYDKVMVMDKGRVVEYDTPAVLMGMPDGIFKSLADKEGTSLSQQLVDEEYKSVTMGLEFAPRIDREKTNSTKNRKRKGSKSSKGSRGGRSRTKSSQSAKSDGESSSVSGSARSGGSNKSSDSSGAGILTRNPAESVSSSGGRRRRGNSASSKGSRGSRTSRSSKNRRRRSSSRTRKDDSGAPDAPDPPPLG